MGKIQAVFLDLGNVLAFHEDAILFQRMSAWGGAAPEQIRERMLKLWDPINRGAVAGDDLRRAVCRVAGSDEPMAAEPFFDLWNCHFRVNQAVLPMVDALCNHVKVLLLSNTNEMHWRFVRPLVPQFARFYDFVISCDLRMAKPDREIFDLALARVGVAAENVAYFDDIKIFVDAACALGIQGRLFTTADTFRTHLTELGLAV
jgi:HAD superfamily hydrolase (TIGR01509 family)